MNAASSQTALFTLMARLSAETRQKIGEQRRAFKMRTGVEERLVEAGEDRWKLEYWQAKQKIAEIFLA